jgi:HK97 family phage major capsid protein
MKTVNELKQERTTLITEAEMLLDAADTAGRNLNDEEQAKYDAVVARVEELNTDIARRMKLEAAAQPTFTAEVSARSQPSAALPDDIVDERDTPVATIRPAGGNGAPRIETMRSYSKLVAFPKTPQGHVAAYRTGMWIRATIYGDNNAAEWCRKNGVGSRAALAGGVNTSGGALVPEEFERAIIDLREQYGLIRQVCRVMPMGSDTRNIPRRKGGLTAYYVGENQSGTESDASWDNVSLVAKKLMVLTRMSSEVDEDAIIDLADQMAQEMAYAFAIKEDTVGFTGTGAATDGGIVGVLVKALDAAHTKAKVTAASGHDTFAEIDSDDLLSLMAAIPKFAKTGAGWYCSPTAEELVFNAIKIAGGGTTRDMLTQADTPRFLGYPIYSTPVFPDDASADYTGLAMIGFGNLQQAMTLGDRRGVRVALSSEQYWEEDQIGVKGTMRHDMNVHDMGSTTEKSPFAVLVGGA